MNLYQRIESLGGMIKVARKDGLQLLGTEFVNKMPEPPKLTSLANVKKPKVVDTTPTLRTQKGAKKPLFTSEMNDTSPYAER